MAVSVVNVQFVGNKGTVTLVSDLAEFPAQIEELQSSAARNEALLEASRHGLSAPAISDLHQAAYPITPEGKPLENPLTERVAGYRVDVSVAGRVL